MTAPLNRLSEHVYAILRIVVGGLFLFHGAQKLFGAFGGDERPLFSFMWFAGAIEFAGGVLVMVGLYAGIAAFLASGQMAVAYFLRHQPEGFWPIQNRGELAALYCFVFLYISARGSGIWSIDAATGRSRPQRREDGDHGVIGRDRSPASPS